MLLFPAVILLVSQSFVGLPNYDIERKENPCRSWAAFETEKSDHIELRLEPTLRNVSSLDVRIGQHWESVPSYLLTDLTAASVAVVDWTFDSKTDTNELSIYSNRECGRVARERWTNRKDHWVRATFTFFHGSLTKRAVQLFSVDGDPEIIVTEVGSK